MSLTLRSLPTLLTDCVIVGHARKADVVFTPRQFFAICAHMMNENPANFFLMPYRDKERPTEVCESVQSGCRRSGSRGLGTQSPAKRKSPASIGFYPTNAERKSRWAGDRLRRARRQPGARARPCAESVRHPVSAATTFCVPDDERGRSRTFGLSPVPVQPRVSSPARIGRAYLSRWRLRSARLSRRRL